MKKALLIIDVQNDYFAGGKCELSHPESALDTVKTLLCSFRKENLPVFYIQHLSDGNTDFFIPGTSGSHIHKAITPLETEKIIVKHHPNSFYKTNLQSELKKKGITDLVLCGMMTHMCVDTTVRAAKDRGYHVTLISNACTSKDLKWNGVTLPAATVGNVYMASLDKKFADVMTSEQYYKLTADENKET
ncbi:cysteine hydrolase family protein [Anaerostipes sp.]|uniref:cysteine hydrolase family protein n=1 Tax=Anaerostipes sp. TaxID=1872530 RepID=UPI0025B93E6A|nr:cysteine hydrolase family protein [Anaerostipes sp.]MBS7009084.1 cysteine hydrolase [Anaerostipes sp.]